MNTNHLPFVSIVICTFNRGNLIDECLNSLIHQTYPKELYEIIVVDDGSPIHTVQTYKNEGVHYIVHEKNKGISAGRNTGLYKARGSVVVYIDDDAAANPDWLTHIVSPFEEDDVVATGGRTYAYKQEFIAERYLAANEYGNPAPLAFGASKHPVKRFLVYLKSMFKPIVAETKQVDVQAVYGLNCAFRTDVLRKVGGFDESLKADEDSEICTRLRLQGARIVYVPNAIIRHRHRESVIKLLVQTFKRSEYTVPYYKKENKTLPIFPFPLFYILLIGIAIFVSIPALIVCILFAPLILYSWWSLRAIKNGKLEYIVYSYIQLLFELFAIMGMVRGRYVLMKKKI